MNCSIKQMSKILEQLIGRYVSEEEIKVALVELGYMKKQGNRYIVTDNGKENCKRGRFQIGAKTIYFNDWDESVISEVRKIIE